MKKLHFISLILIFISPIGFAINLPNGGVVAGEISFVGEVDEFTFAANAGDTVFLRVADTETTEFVNSDFSPRVTLIGPGDDVILANSGNPTAGGLVAHIDGVTLLETGSYTVRVRDDSPFNDETGSYNIYFVKGPGANDDGVLPNGGMLSGEIDLGDLDSYTFEAVAGETVFVRVADTETTELVNSGFSPHVSLLGPDGSVVLANSGSPSAGGLVAHIDGITLLEAGTYTVVVRDDSTRDDEAGSYDIYFAKGPGANDDGVLPNGGMLSGEIDLGDLDTYTFEAVAGEAVFVRVADTETTELVNSGFSPHVSLLGPDGSVVLANSGSPSAGGLVAHIDGITLLEAGTYTVVVRDDSTFDDEAGSYDIYFAKAPGASELGCLADGQFVIDRIDVGDLDSITFNAIAGTSVLITVTDLDESTFTPRWHLYGPAGNLVGTRNGFTIAQLSVPLVESGGYTLIIRDSSAFDDSSANYRLDISGASIACPAAECNGRSVTVFIGNGDSPSSSADIILGTTGADIINGLGGDDTICGLGGNDIINAGGGDDWVDGGAGNDDLNGSAGSDMLFGGLGDDVIRGGSGDDEMEGEEGGDSLIGQTGMDTIDGGDGVDDINGGPGNDTIFTGAGATVGSGLVVSGSGGDDIIFGGPDADHIIGSNGADTINGEGGNDLITGGSGRDVINGGDGNDDIRGQDSRDTINGDAGDDIINGGNENDTINGGTGDDDINGGPGNDVLRGDSGSDDVRGGSGDDRLTGGSSTGDVCNGQSGTDIVFASCESITGVP